MNITKKTIIITVGAIIVILFSGNSYPVFAQNKIPADHVAIGFEKIKEKITLFSNFSKSGKTKYQIVLTEKRLAELKYAVDSGQTDLVEPTSSRYATYVGKLTNYIIKNNQVSFQKELNSLFEMHKGTLEIMRNKFIYDSAWWLMLQQDIDTVNIFQIKLNSLNAS